MSFSSDVKEELSRQYGHARHCQIAELAAIFSTCGSVMLSAQDEFSMRISTENVGVAQKAYKLCKIAFEITPEITIRPFVKFGRNKLYILLIRNAKSAERILKAFRILKADGALAENLMVDDLVVQQTCCKRAYIRGTFLTCGSFSDPTKHYHCEIVCQSEEKAVQIRDMINSFEGIDAKIVPRKNSFVVYLKEGTQIVELLNVMEGHKALMELENVRILKEMRNHVNRQVNCEAANLNKTAVTAAKQIKDIELIRDTVGLSSLPENLEELAYIRLEYPEAPLKDLGQYLASPIGKSGVNHRLKKISEIADSLRNAKGGKEE